MCSLMSCASISWLLVAWIRNLPPSPLCSMIPQTLRLPVAPVRNARAVVNGLACLELRRARLNRRWHFCCRTAICAPCSPPLPSISMIPRRQQNNTDFRLSLLQSTTTTKNFLAFPHCVPVCADVYCLGNWVSLVPHITVQCLFVISTSTQSCTCILPEWFWA